MHFKVLNKDVSVIEELLPTDILSDHIRVYDVHEDALIEAYKLAAIDFAEQYMNRAILPQTVKSTFETFRKRTYLPFGTVRSITSVTAIKGDQLVELKDYRYNDVSNELVLGESCKGFTDYVVLYEVGENPDQVAHAIKIGVMKLVATWYENREDVANGVSVAQVPFNHLACFNLFRIPPSV